MKTNAERGLYFFTADGYPGLMKIGLGGKSRINAQRASHPPDCLHVKALLRLKNAVDIEHSLVRLLGKPGVAGGEFLDLSKQSPAEIKTFILQFGKFSRGDEPEKAMSDRFWEGQSKRKGASTELRLIKKRANFADKIARGRCQDCGKKRDNPKLKSRCSACNANPRHRENAENFKAKKK